MNKYQKYNLMLNAIAFLLAVAGAYAWTYAFEWMSYIEFTSYIPMYHIILALAMMIALWSVLELYMNKYLKYLGLVFNICCGLSILIPLLHTLPLNIESPEMFPMWMIPMHFLAPLFLFAFQSWKKY